MSTTFFAQMLSETNVSRHAKNDKFCLRKIKVGAAF